MAQKMPAAMNQRARSQKQPTHAADDEQDRQNQRSPCHTIGKRDLARVVELADLPADGLEHHRRKERQHESEQQDDQVELGEDAQLPAPLTR